MKRTLIYSQMAQADLDEIFDFITADNARRAKTDVDEIRQACRTLCDTPLLGVLRLDLREGLYILPLWRRIVIAYQFATGQGRCPAHPLGGAGL